MHASEGEMVCTSTNTKIPYFNAPIYLENKTAVGKVDEILGPINQVYFTIKPQEGIVATSFKNGDKFYIGGDKLLPLERYTSSRQTCCNSTLTHSPDSCPSPSPLPVLLRSRSPLAVAVPAVDSPVVAAHVVDQEVDSADVVVQASVAVVVPVVVQEAVSSLAAARVVSVDVAAALVAVVAAVAVAVVTKRSHLDTIKSAKRVGVNRQRRHGVLRPWTAWEMVHKEALFRKEAVHLMFYAVQDYFEYREEEQKNYFNFIRSEGIVRYTGDSSEMIKKTCDSCSARMTSMTSY